MKKMIEKVWEITRAWKNWMCPTKSQEEIAEERMKVCETCPLKVKQLGVDVCEGCGCPLMAKVYSPKNSCPKGKWKA